MWLILHSSSSLASPLPSFLFPASFLPSSPCPGAPRCCRGRISACLPGSRSPALSPPAPPRCSHHGCLPAVSGAGCGTVPANSTKQHRYPWVLTWEKEPKMRNEKREGACGRSWQYLSPGAGCSKLSERSPHGGRGAGAAGGPWHQQRTRGQCGGPLCCTLPMAKQNSPLGAPGVGAPRGLGVAPPRYQPRLFPVTPPWPAGAPHPREKLRDESKAGKHPKVTASIFWGSPRDTKWGRSRVCTGSRNL